MLITMLKSKIHRATVTEARTDYIGSITIDKLLMDAAGIVEYEQVHVVDVDNANRLVTYVIAGEPGSGIICLNGAAARLVNVGDKIIIMAYGQMEFPTVKGYRPAVVFVDSNNRVCEKNTL